MDHRQAEGDRYTVVTRSGSDKLNGIIDQILTSETGASIPPKTHGMTSPPPTIAFACFGTR